MACQSQMRQNRNLTLLLALFLVLTNTTTVALLHLLPPDPLHLALNISLYSFLCALISLLGFVGVYLRSPTLLHIFSNHLLLDAFLSTIPRLLLLYLFVQLPGSLCAQLAHDEKAVGDDGRYVGLGIGVSEGRNVARQCATAVWVTGGSAVVVLLGLTTLQWLCAWRVREFSSACESLERSRAEVGKDQLVVVETCEKAPMDV